MKKFLVAQKSIGFVRSIREIFDEEYNEHAQEYDEILQTIKNSQQQFTDTNFPPQSSSLSLSELPKSWKKLTWKRANEIFEDFDIFSGCIEPSDIKQGILGDCYFLCALSVIAEKCELVKRLFHNSEVSQYGLYAVWLNINGEWTSVVIDDYFPCTDNLPAFSRANGLWVMLLEKAYAKVYGSYLNIEGGNPAIAMRDLTGAPYENKESGSAQEFWEYCEQNHAQGFLLTAYTKEAELINHENELGLLAGHAYAILKLANVLDQNNKLCRIMQMRNPWGRVEWKGDWCDSSNKWTEQTKQQYSVEDNDDGIFWMSIEDFRTFFAGIGVCKIKNDYIYNSIQCQLNEQNNCIIHLDMVEDSHIYISFNQNDNRFHLNQIGDYRYSFVRIIVSELVNDTLKYISGIYRADRNVVVEQNLKKGQYLVFIELQWQYPQIQIISTLSTYASKKAKLKRINGLDYLNSIRNIIKDYSDNNVNKLKEINYLDQYNKNIFKRIGIVDGYLFLHYQNQTFDSILQEVIHFSDTIGYVPISPLQSNSFQKDGSLKIQFTSPPQSIVIILLSQVRSSIGKCQYTQQSQSQIICIPQKHDQYDNNQFILKQLNLSQMQLVGRHKLNVKYYYQAHLQTRFKNQNIIKIFEPQPENIELTSLETSIFYYFHDFLSEIWEPFIFYIIMLNLLLIMILNNHRTHLAQISNLLLFISQILSGQKQKKSIIRIMSKAQFISIFLEIIIRLLSFECQYFTLPPNQMTVLYKFLLIITIFLNFLLFVCILKFLIHYETIETEIFNPMQIRLNNYLKKLSSI
ncbi:unnamed protein product [Paramecium primaurelia]|uniref:Calpain catalytic domain-containing protein n=1 Tax=Paramecium primaurelia TaxID=5886 RepID=A0A8S1NJT1_PARPR|nr:unnamed protein product [Paramecium primaurelia]